MRLLILEDDEALVRAVDKGMRRQGYAVDTAFNGEEGYELLEINEYDLLILDLNLPSMDGFQIAKEIRLSQPGLLILILTARARLKDRVAGLDLGADDYLTKPFHMDELSARVRALLRRDMRVREILLHHSDLKLDPASRIVWQDNRRLELTRKEFGILHYLMSRPGEVVSQEMLLEHVWNNDVDSFTNVVPVHIGSLRRKLGECARDPHYLETVIGQGYRLVTLDDADFHG